MALTKMGYKIAEQSPWGAAALIAVGGSGKAAALASSGNDSTATGEAAVGLFHGANDPRRPAGAAIGY